MSNSDTARPRATESPPSLLDCTIDAALQLWLMKPKVLRKPGTQPEWFEKLLFAVDTNVVHDYLDPHGMLKASRASPRLPIGKIFHFDSESSNATLRSQIVDYVVEALPRRTPLTFLPSLADEMRNNLSGFRDAVTDRALTHLTGGFAQEAEKIYRRLASSVGGINRLAPILKIEQIESLLLRERNNEVDWLSHRLRRLYVEGRLVSFDRIADSDFRRALQPQTDANFRKNYAAKLLDWKERIAKATKTRAFDTKKYRNDIAALAQLEIANERLAGRCAILYVTADSLIIEASEAYLLSQSGFGWSSVLDVDFNSPEAANLTFGDLFVRHPNAFLEEAVGTSSIAKLWSETADAPNGDDEDLASWLTVWVGRLSDPAAPGKPPQEYRPTIGHLEGGRFHLPRQHEDYINTVVQVEESDPDDNRALELKQAWEGYISASSERPTEMIDRLRSWSPPANAGESEAIRALTELKRRVEYELAQGAQDSFSNLFELTMQTRVALQLSAPDKVAVEPLVIILDGRPAALEFMHRAETEWTGQRVRRVVDELAAVIEDYEKLRHDVEAEEEKAQRGHQSDGEHRYTYYLVHAFFLSQDRQWRTAEILSDRALASICAHEEEAPAPGRKLNIRASNGREAYFARGYCRRMHAENVEDLKASRKDLERAHAILKAEGGLDGKADFDAVVERIRCELLMHDMMEVCFTWAENPVDPDLETRVQRLLESLGAFITQTDRSRYTSGTEMPTGAERLVRDFQVRGFWGALERAAGAYLALYLQFGSLDHFSSNATVRLAIEILAEAELHLDLAHTSTAGMTRAALRLADLLLDPPAIARELQRALSEPPLATFEGAQFRFDRARFREMKDRVSEKIYSKI